MIKKPFLSAGYEAPSGDSRYMKLQDGENRIRVLGPAFEGAELWVNGKPLRRKTTDDFTPQELRDADINKMTNAKSTPKPILAFPVYNYEEGLVQILQISQVTILRELQKLFVDEDWGDPQEYALVINRGKTGQRVSYTVTPKPKQALKAEVEEAWKAIQNEGFNIDNLLTGANPFGTGSSETTKESTETESDTNDELDNGDI